MKISERTVKRVAEIITGDKSLSPYRSGPKLVGFFNEFGTNHTYGQGFPSRWMFAEDCIRQFNDTPALKKIILSAVDPRDFMGATVYDKDIQQNNPANLQDALTYLNEFLAYDGYEIVPHGKGYDVVDKTRGEIIVDVKLEPSHLSHDFIMEQIEKCRTKTSQGDYDGDVTGEIIFWAFRLPVLGCFEGRRGAENRLDSARSFLAVLDLQIAGAELEVNSR